MFSKILIAAIFFSFILLGCAKPNYQNIIPVNPEGSRDLGECALKLSKLNQCVSLTWVKYPTNSEIGIFVLEFAQKFDQDLKVYLWMPSMNHGSRPTVITRLSENQFEVSKVAFTMPGEWEIRIRAQEKNQVIDEVAYALTY